MDGGVEFAHEPFHHRLRAGGAEPVADIGEDAMAAPVPDGHIDDVYVFQRRLENIRAEFSATVGQASEGRIRGHRVLGQEDRDIRHHYAPCGSGAALAPLVSWTVIGA